MQNRGDSMKYIVLTHEEQEFGGYWGECPELPVSAKEKQLMN